MNNTDKPKDLQFVKLRDIDVPFTGTDIDLSLTGKEVKILTVEAESNPSVMEALKPEGMLVMATIREFSYGQELSEDLEAKYADLTAKPVVHYVRLKDKAIPFTAEDNSFTLKEKEVKILTAEIFANASVKEGLKPEGSLIAATEQQFKNQNGSLKTAQRTQPTNLNPVPHNTWNGDNSKLV
jgi:hypothetical protein